MKCFHCKKIIKNSERKRDGVTYVPYQPKENGAHLKRYWCKAKKCQDAIDSEYPKSHNE